MSIMEWNERLDIGIDEMNAEHLSILVQMNELHTLITGNADREDISAAFEGLIAVTSGHFQAEEAYMQSIKYPGFEVHQAIHVGLSEKLQGYRDAFGRGNTLGHEFFEFFKFWLLSHINGVDRKYATYTGKGDW